MFDKANKSEKIEIKKDHLEDLNKQQAILSEKQKDLEVPDDIEKNKLLIKNIDKLKKKVEKSITENNDEL